MLQATLKSVISKRELSTTQSRTQFKGTEFKGRRCSDHMRQREKQSTLENWNGPSAFTWELQHF